MLKQTFNICHWNAGLVKHLCQRQNSEHQKLSISNIQNKGYSKEILQFLPIKIIESRLYVFTRNYTLNFYLHYILHTNLLNMQAYSCSLQGKTHLLHENICCGYSLETPRWGASNEYPQHMFSWRNKKDISILRMKKAPFLLLCPRTGRNWLGYETFIMKVSQ